MENEQLLSDSKVSCEEWSEEDVKEGEEDCKDDSSDVGKMVAKTMQVTRVRQVTWVLSIKMGTIRKEFLI